MSISGSKLTLSGIKETNETILLVAKCRAQYPEAGGTYSNHWA
jgi:hypothetical protein